MNEMDAEVIAERDVRSEPRLADSKKGVLSNKEVWSPCLIQNISGNGFMILCDYKSAVGDLPPKLGEVLNLKWSAHDDEVEYCRIEVRHITDGYFGALVLEKSELANEEWWLS